MRYIQSVTDTITLAEVKVKSECLYQIGVLYWPFLKIKEMFTKAKYPNFTIRIYYSLSSQVLSMTRNDEPIECSFESLDQASDYAKSLFKIYKDLFPLLYADSVYCVTTSYWSLKSNDNSIYESLKTVLKKYNNQPSKPQLSTEMLMKQKRLQTETVQNEYDKIVI